MTDRAAFLAALRAAPGDRTPMLVFADWLDENGEPGLAADMRHEDMPRCLRWADAHGWPVEKAREYTPAGAWETTARGADGCFTLSCEAAMLPADRFGFVAEYTSMANAEPIFGCPRGSVQLAGIDGATVPPTGSGRARYNLHFQARVDGEQESSFLPRLNFDGGGPFVGFVQFTLRGGVGLPIPVADFRELLKLFDGGPGNQNPAPAAATER